MADQTRVAAPVVSNAQELQYAAATIGSGEPTHSPRVAFQSYTDTATLTVYKWMNNDWDEGTVVPA